MSIFDLLIWVGAALTLGGVAALGWCVLTVARAKRAGMDEAGLRNRMRGVLVVNMGALALSFIGLMMVVIGIMLAP